MMTTRDRLSCSGKSQGTFLILYSNRTNIYKHTQPYVYCYLYSLFKKYNKRYVLCCVSLSLTTTNNKWNEIFFCIMKWIFKYIYRVKNEEYTKPIFLFLARERNRENKWNMQNIEIRIELKREKEWETL